MESERILSIEYRDFGDNVEEQTDAGEVHAKIAVSEALLHVLGQCVHLHTQEFNATRYPIDLFPFAQVAGIKERTPADR